MHHHELLAVRGPSGLAVRVSRDLWPEVRGHGATLAPVRQERSPDGPVLLDLAGCRLSDCVSALPAAAWLSGRAAQGGRALWVRCPGPMEFLFRRLAATVWSTSEHSGAAHDGWGLRYDLAACLQQAAWATDDRANPVEAISAAVGCRPAMPSHSPDPAERAVVRESLDGRPLVVLQPRSGSPAKDWPDPKWPNLRARLRDLPGRPLVAAAHSEPLPVDVAALASNYDLGLFWCPVEKLAAWLAEAALIVAPDSLCLHLGAAVGAPALGLFGPLDGREALRWLPSARALQAPRPEGLPALAVLDVLAACREELSHV